MGTAIESGVGTLNYGRQSVKGTKATAATTTIGYNKPKWFGGALKSGKTLGSEDYVDGNRFSSPSMFTDKVGGDVGTVTIQVQPENAGLFAAAILGVDTVTGTSDPYTHTITSAGTSGQWGTWWQKVGAAIGPERELYSDSKIGKLVMTGGQDQNVLHYDLSIMSLNPGEVFTTDPAKTEDTSDPLLWTEVTGAVTFDSTVDSDANEETLEIDTGMQPYYGDNILPSQLIEAKGTIVSTVKSIVTDTTLGFYRKAVYNTAAPTAGTQPVKTVYYASLVTVYTRSATRTMTVTRPKIAVRPDDMVVAPQPQGGPNEISFGGPCLKSGATPALTIVVLSGDATTYA